MEAHNLPEALNLIMEQRGCSGSQLARDLGVSQQWVSDVSRGKQDTPTAKAIQLLASVGWEMVIRPKREEEDPVKRREFHDKIIKLAGGTFAEKVTGVTFVAAPKAGPYEDPAQVRHLARRIARARFEHGGGTIATTAIRHVRRIESVVTSRDRKLQEAASELAVEAIWTLNEVSRVEAGENVGGLALKLAEGSGSAHAQSRVYSALTTLNLDHGNAARALKYANLGVGLPEVPEIQQAWMRLRKGWALAHVRGQEIQARDEIENVRGLLQDAAGFARISQFEIADMTGMIGLSLNDLGVYGQAQAAFSQGVEGVEESPALAAFFLAHQIKAALNASQLSLAASRIQKFARIAPLVNSPRVDKHVGEVLTMSARWTANVRDMRDARNQLKAVVVPNARA